MPVVLDELPHRDEALDGLVVVEAIAGRGPFRMDDAVPPLPDADGRDAQSTPGRGLFDGVHGLCSVAAAATLDKG